MRFLAPVILIALSLTAMAQSYTVESVPNVKLQNNSYVSNPDGILSKTTVNEINTMLDSVESKTSAQVAVVVLNSIGDADIFDFAQQLFVRWGIGQKGDDNGLLILFVSDKHTIRFHTGFGLEEELPDVICKRIQQQYMVPAFKSGNYNEGILLGIRQIATRLENPQALNEEPTNTQQEVVVSDYYIFFMGLLFIVLLVAYFGARINHVFSPSDDPNWIGLSGMRWLVLYALIPYTILIVAFNTELSLSCFYLIMYGYFISILLERRFRIKKLSERFIKNGDNQGLYEFYKKQKRRLIFAAIFFPLPMAIVYILHKRNLKSYRNLPRKCKKCGSPATKLTEQTEDEFLKPGQISEELLGSRDYDVWKCTVCNSVEYLNYPGTNSDFAKCPKCKSLTYYEESRRNLTEPTYSTTGLQEVVSNCFHCHHKVTKKLTLAMLVASTSSSDYSSSSSSSSSSSDSDSGGSWGGGDSGGGGASSSW